MYFTCRILRIRNLHGKLMISIPQCQVKCVKYIDHNNCRDISWSRYTVWGNVLFKCMPRLEWCCQIIYINLNILSI